MYQKITCPIAGADSGNRMEREPISKNRVSPKNEKSRKNFKVKSLFYAVLALMAVPLLFNACQEEEKEQDRLEVNPTYLTFEAGGGSQTVSVTSNGLWIASPSSTWCSANASGNGNGYITISVEENTSTNSRNATVFVQSGSLQSTINVSQSGATNGGGGGTLSTPANVTAVQSGNSVVISWSGVANAVYYHIYRSNTATGSYSNIESVSSSSTDYIDNTPFTGDNYYKIAAYAYLSGGEGPMSNYAYCNYTSGGGGGGGTSTAPSAPTGVTAVNEGPVAYPVIFIRWNSVSNATSYKVYRSSSANGSYSQIGSATDYPVSTDDNPRQGDNYYKVKAVNSVGESAYSDYAYYNHDPGGSVSPCPVIYGNCTATSTTITMRWTVPTTTGCGTPTKAYLRVKHPDSGVYVDLQTLSGTATSASFAYGMWADSEGYVYVGIITENAAGTSGGLIPKVYNWKTNTWY
jgi:hypothetical protein